MHTGFFKLYKPREYKYKPIYYDPKKEAAKERERKLEQEANGDGSYTPRIQRGSFREQADKLKNTRGVHVRQSNIRLFIILAILFAIAYYLIM